MSADPPPPPPPPPLPPASGRAPFRPPPPADRQPLEEFFVDVRGPLDRTTADGWWWRLMAEFRTRVPFRTTVALGEVTAIDRAGVDVLLSLAGAQAERGRPVWFAEPPAAAREALLAAGLGHTILDPREPSGV